MVHDFPPEYWNLDLAEVYQQHFDQPYFYPVVSTTKEEITGTGIAVVNQNIAWLGTIIVKPEYRNQGIGTKLTHHLINYTGTREVETLLLTASKPRLNIYKKIGFLHDIEYLWFKQFRAVKINSGSKNIAEINDNDHQDILKIDRMVSGEKRDELLLNSIQNGYKYSHGKTRGYYLPHFGKGLIIADSVHAGLELMKLRLSVDRSPLCIPETNKAAKDFLNANGYFQFASSPRMYLYNRINWAPAMVFSRGSGYTG